MAGDKQRPGKWPASWNRLKRESVEPGAAATGCLRTLGRQYWDEVAISQIPPNVFVASKSGAVDESRNEIFYVNAPHPYIFSIFTKNNTDQSWDYNNEAWVLTAKIVCAFI